MNSEKRFELLKARNVSDIISDTFIFIKENFRSLINSIVYSRLPVIIVFIISSIIVAKSQTLSSLIENNETYDNYNGYENTGASLIFSILYLLSILMMSLFIPTLSITYVKLYKNTVEINGNALWKEAQKYFSKIIGVYILIAFVAVAISLFFIFLGIAFFGAILLSGMSFVLAMPLFIICIALIFFLHTRYSLCMQFIILEDLGIAEALKKSFSFTKNVFWELFLLNFILGTLSGVAFKIFEIPSIILPSFFGNILSNIGLGCSLLFSSITYIGTTIFYYSKKEEREGIQADLEIDNIGKKEDL